MSSTPSPYTSTSTPCRVIRGERRALSQSVKLGMKMEVSSLLPRIVRLCLMAISISSGKGSKLRVRIRAGMGFSKNASKHFRRSSELWLLR